MRVTRVIASIFVASLLLAPLCGCAKKTDTSQPAPVAKPESGSPPATANKVPQSPAPATPAKAEKETAVDDKAGSQKQVEEVRSAFVALQQVCRANDIDGYLAFWDDQTKKLIDGEDPNDRREHRRVSLTKNPGILQEIAGAEIESITANTSQAESIKSLLGVEIKGAMLLVRTKGRAFLFHETVQGWRLFTIAPSQYFR
jgi:hypothetical protein